VAGRFSAPAGARWLSVSLQHAFLANDSPVITIPEAWTPVMPGSTHDRRPGRNCLDCAALAQQ
jgi:hypothetical protein